MIFKMFVLFIAFAAGCSMCFCESDLHVNVSKGFALAEKYPSKVYDANDSSGDRLIYFYIDKNPDVMKCFPGWVLYGMVFGDDPHHTLRISKLLVNKKGIPLTFSSDKDLLKFINLSVANKVLEEDEGQSVWLSVFCALRGYVGFEDLQEINKDVFSAVVNKDYFGVQKCKYVFKYTDAKGVEILSSEVVESIDKI